MAGRARSLRGVARAVRLGAGAFGAWLAPAGLFARLRAQGRAGDSTLPHSLVDFASATLHSALSRVVSTATPVETLPGKVHRCARRSAPSVTRAKRHPRRLILCVATSVARVTGLGTTILGTTILGTTIPRTTILGTTIPPTTILARGRVRTRGRNGELSFRVRGRHARAPPKSPLRCLRRAHTSGSRLRVAG